MAAWWMLFTYRIVVEKMALLLHMELSPRSTLKYARERATQNLEAAGSYANNRPRADPGASFKESGSEV